MEKIRVVIVDDSSLARGLLHALFDEASDIEVIGEASNGRQAVERVRELKPDLVTMDLEMPVMGGMAAIEEIMCTRAVPILVVSSVANAQNALEAVAHGALDVVSKPEYTPANAAEFVAKVRMLAGVPVITRLRSRKPPAAVSDLERGGGDALAAVPTTASCLAAKPSVAAGDCRQIVAIACSTGGPQALAQILPALPRDFPCAVVVAQHISDGFAQGLVDWLGSLCTLPVRLGRAGDLIAAGTVFISPSEQHMTVAANRRLTLVERGNQDIYRPSCDVLLNSVAHAFGPKAIGVILTGMGHDGAAGMAAIRAAGGATLGQDEASSIIYGMNRTAIENGAVQQVLPLGKIAAALIECARRPPDRALWSAV